ncbi:DUF2064 domain-containing protein [Leeuwenhoekiella polynyae]|uniref:DUF2064 domain-containing protein n=1 Tax=Leeuwenhoekiella polynyae TaxID=1550906 RepID=A0A4Q0P326_9FLAO|nr:DUF2064 domain-containing protein [Leeuwenhoekiella polynyae]RXG18629.1 hypothetical protein DSM02_3049 [Leeuwenhoekiella polynyae]
MNTKTAILIFARSAQQEALDKGFRNAVSVFEVLNAQVLKTVKQTGLPYFLYSEEKQRGTTFGERFTHAIQDIYNLGFDQIISVGNDSPHLTKKHFIAAEEHLKTYPLVLGPSVDGGFYLMGLKKSHFNPVSFLKLPWQTQGLMTSIIRLVHSKKIEAAVLETLQDLDTASDISQLLQVKKSLPFQIQHLLKKYVQKAFQTSYYQNLFFQKVCSLTYYNKGSPVSLSI